MSKEQPTTSEFDTQTDILRLLGDKPNIWIWRQNVGKAHSIDESRWVQFGVKGMGDIGGHACPLYIWNRYGYAPIGTARAFWIETKAPKGKQNDDQKRFQSWVERVGALYMVTRDPDEVHAMFCKLGWFA